MLFKALIAFSDLYSWINPVNMTIKIITRMVYAVTDLPIKKERSIAPASRYTMKLLLICRNKIFKDFISADKKQFHCISACRCNASLLFYRQICHSIYHSCDNLDGHIYWIYPR